MTIVVILGDWTLTFSKCGVYKIQLTVENHVAETNLCAECYGPLQKAVDEHVRLHP